MSFKKTGEFILDEWGFGPAEETLQLKMQGILRKIVAEGIEDFLDQASCNFGVDGIRISNCDIGEFEFVLPYLFFGESASTKEEKAAALKAIRARLDEIEREEWLE